MRARGQIAELTSQAETARGTGGDREDEAGTAGDEGETHSRTRARNSAEVGDPIRRGGGVEAMFETLNAQIDEAVGTREADKLPLGELHGATGLERHTLQFGVRSEQEHMCETVCGLHTCHKRGAQRGSVRH